MRQETGVEVRRKSSLDRQGQEREVLRIIPESAGPRLATLTGGAIYSVRPPRALAFQAKEHCARIMLAPSPELKASPESDHVREHYALAGTLVINPANVDGTLSWSGTMESVVIALTPEALDELAVQEFKSGRIELQPPPLGTVDTRALHIAELLKLELRNREAPSELFIDSLITVFGIHMLRNYSNLREPLPVVTGGLSAGSARTIREFLDENFSRPLTIAELAAVAGVSRRHFIRTFARTFGKPPHQYLIQMRLDFAESLLLKGELSIAEVTYLSGFSSQSHLTAIMKHYRGLTPAAVRRSK